MTEQTFEPAAPQYTNYWGVTETHRHMLPDNTQFFEYKTMNEGDKSKFQKLTNQDLVVQRDQSARVRVDPVTERHTLIKTSVTGWHMFAPDHKTGEMLPAAFSAALLEKWLTVADPKVVEDLEHAIRLSNPWMQADMTLEEIDKEIERLHEVRRSVVDREAGEAISGTK